MIQDAAQLNVLTGLLDMEAQRWGVQIQFVKVQRVVYSHNPQILSLVKDTENKNKEIKRFTWTAQPECYMSEVGKCDLYIV